MTTSPRLYFVTLPLEQRKLFQVNQINNQTHVSGGMCSVLQH